MNYKVKNKIELDTLTRKVIFALQEAGAKVYLVGGIVRDLFIVNNSKQQDIDVEVYGIDVETMYDILSQFGKVGIQGKCFGVLRVDCLKNVDFAIARTETKTGLGHRDFIIKCDHNLSIEDATLRRDFTMNAMLYDIDNDEVIDLYGGMDDIAHKCIRMISKKHFIEDPLRVMRAAQFASRFGFTIESKTKAVCHQMVKEGMLNHLPNERIYEEYRKMLLSMQPSIGLRFLQSIGGLPSYLSAMEKTDQRPDYHPEGNVFEHCMLVVDLGAIIKEKTSNPEAFMWSCLLHDIGKATTTTSSGSAPNHASVGVDIFDSEVITLFPRKYHKYVKTMIRYHMTIAYMARKGKSDYYFYKLLEKIDKNIPLNDLVYLTKCDKLGRGYLSYLVIEQIDEYLLKKPKDLPRPLISGKDIEYIEPKDRKSFLENAFDLQLQGKSREEIMQSCMKGRV